MEPILSLQEKNELKSKGIVPQKQDGYFAIRVIGKSGVFTSREFSILSKVADQYGNKELNLTSRLTVEIPYIKYDDIEKVINIVQENGLIVGGGGKTVRAILSCKGSVCSNGLLDTQKISKEVHNEFFGRELPAKFKIAVLGCKNSYGKAQSNDLSILPLTGVRIDNRKCIECKVCLKVCPDKAFEYKDGKYSIIDDKCSNFGKCVSFCPAHAVESDSEKIDILVFIGGRMGREASLGKPLRKKFKEEDILQIIDTIVNYFKENANEGERFAQLIDRVGFDKVEECIINSI